jgi:hypothetical protein
MSLSSEHSILCFHVSKKEQKFFYVQKISNECYDKSVLFELITRECDSICHEGRTVDDDDRLDANVVLKSLQTCDLLIVYFYEDTHSIAGFSCCNIGQDHIYIDTICTRKAMFGMGKHLFHHICKIAKTRNKQGILLFSTKGAKKAYWKWGLMDVKARVPGSIYFGMTNPRTLSLSNFQMSGRVQRSGWMVFLLYEQMI